MFAAPLDSRSLGDLFQETSAETFLERIVRAFEDTHSKVHSTDTTHQRLVVVHHRLPSYHHEEERQHIETIRRVRARELWREVIDKVRERQTRLRSEPRPIIIILQHPVEREADRMQGILAPHVESGTGEYDELLQGLVGARDKELRKKNKATQGEMEALKAEWMEYGGDNDDFLLEMADVNAGDSKRPFVLENSSNEDKKLGLLFDYADLEKETTEAYVVAKAARQRAKVRGAVEILKKSLIVGPGVTRVMTEWWVTNDILDEMLKALPRTIRAYAIDDNIDIGRRMDKLVDWQRNRTRIHAKVMAVLLPILEEESGKLQSVHTAAVTLVKKRKKRSRNRRAGIPVVSTMGDEVEVEDLPVRGAVYMGSQPRFEDD
jgi:hypothetical protein